MKDKYVSIFIANDNQQIKKMNDKFTVNYNQPTKKMNDIKTFDTNK